MKHNVKVGITVLLILLGFCIPVFSLTGTVVSVTGKVELQTASGWTPLEKGDTIESGLIISTGFRSQAVLQVAGSNIVVNQLTRLTLEQLTETNDSHNSEVFLDLGSIQADVQGAENKRVGFVVNTPVATASVRGTNYLISLSALKVNRGLIDYSAENGSTVSVPGGFSSKIGTSGKPFNPFLNRVNEVLGLVSDNDDNEGLPPSISNASFNAVSNGNNNEVTTGNLLIILKIDD